MHALAPKSDPHTAEADGRGLDLERRLAAYSAAAAALLGPSAAHGLTLSPIGDTIGNPGLGHLDYVDYDLDGDNYLDFAFYWTGGSVEVMGFTNPGYDPYTGYFNTYYNTIAARSTESGLLAVPVGFDTQVDVAISVIGGGSGVGDSLRGDPFTITPPSGPVQVHTGESFALIDSLGGFGPDPSFLAAHFFNGFDPGALTPMAFFQLHLNPDGSVTLDQAGIEDGTQITTPVPEPSPLALLALGAAGLGAWRRRARSG
jgi:hypothetical protein